MRAAMFALFFVAAPVMAADADNDYYPMKIGTKWTFKIGGQDDKFVVTALKEEKVGAQDCVKFEARLKDQLVGSEHIAILKDGVYRFKFGDQTIDPPICFFKASAKKGDSWEQKFKIGESSATGKYEMDIEDVEVPAGKFKGALVVKADAIEQAGGKEMVTKTTIWFVKNMGMVKQVINIADTRITLELEKIEEPKK